MPHEGGPCLLNSPQVHFVSALLHNLVMYPAPSCSVHHFARRLPFFSQKNSNPPLQLAVALLLLPSLTNPTLNSSIFNHPALNRHLHHQVRLHDITPITTQRLLAQSFPDMTFTALFAYHASYYEFVNPQDDLPSSNATHHLMLFRFGARNSSLTLVTAAIPN
jgi:hypothetical protein